jgi:large subunit ribosomal protein L4
MKLPVYNQTAEKVGEVDLNDKIFGVKPSLHLMAEAVRIQLANARKGLAHTKHRGEVSGGGKKPWKQKGTGRARAGSIRSPLWRGGGITFGPRSDRNWELKINKKAKTKALFMSLSDKAKDGKIIVIDTVKIDSAKTKDFVKMLSVFNDKLKLGKKQMFLMPKKDDNLVRASRNIQAVNSTVATSLNIADVMRADQVIMLKDSLPVIEKTYLKISVKPAKASSKASTKSAPDAADKPVKPSIKPEVKASAKPVTKKPAKAA